MQGNIRCDTPLINTSEPGVGDELNDLLSTTSLE